MRTIEFKGIEVEYDETVTKKWSWQKALASNDTAKGLDAIDRLLCGRSDEYAEMLDDDADAMRELITAITSEMASKN